MSPASALVVSSLCSLLHKRRAGPAQIDSANANPSRQEYQRIRGRGSGRRRAGAPERGSESTWVSRGACRRRRRLARELEQRLEPVYREHGLESGWYDVLATLRRAGPPYRLRRRLADLLRKLQLGLPPR
jgi:hypothetical protein